MPVDSPNIEASTAPDLSVYRRAVIPGIDKPFYFPKTMSDDEIKSAIEKDILPKYKLAGNEPSLIHKILQVGWDATGGALGRGGYSLISAYNKGMSELGLKGLQSQGGQFFNDEPSMLGGENSIGGRAVQGVRGIASLISSPFGMLNPAIEDGGKLIQNTVGKVAQYGVEGATQSKAAGDFTYGLFDLNNHLKNVSDAFGKDAGFLVEKLGGSKQAKDIATGFGEDVGGMLPFVAASMAVHGVTPANQVVDYSKPHDIKVSTEENPKRNTTAFTPDDFRGRAVYKALTEFNPEARKLELDKIKNQVTRSSEISKFHTEAIDKIRTEIDELQKHVPPKVNKRIGELAPTLAGDADISRTELNKIIAEKNSQLDALVAADATHRRIIKSGEDILSRFTPSGETRGYTETNPEKMLPESTIGNSDKPQGENWAKLKIQEANTFYEKAYERFLDDPSEENKMQLQRASDKFNSLQNTGEGFDSATPADPTLSGENVPEKPGLVQYQAPEDASLTMQDKTGGETNRPVISAEQKRDEQGRIQKNPRVEAGQEGEVGKTIKAPAKEKPLEYGKPDKDFSPTSSISANMKKVVEENTSDYSKMSEDDAVKESQRRMIDTENRFPCQ